MGKHERISKSERIRELNDALRKTDVGGRIMLTSGFNAYNSEFKTKALEAIKAFDAFTADDDPYGEHDFVSVEVDGVTVFWKCDYYDKDIRYGSDDPSDPERTTRIATVLLGSEY